MGQRHQIFIFTKNQNEILRKETNLDNEVEWKGKLEEFLQAKKNYNKHKLELGEEKETILAFHHQWLYGATAVGNVYQFMQFLLNTDEQYGLFSDNYIIGYNGAGDNTVQKYIDRITSIMTIQNNIIGNTIGGRTGIERFTYMNGECDGEYAEDYRTRYDCGDNNDGCTIIDTINKKYCFVDFHGICDNALPLNTPISAVDYYKAYYPVEEHLLSEYDIRESTAEKVVKSHIRDAKKIEKLFKGIKLMTHKDLQNMFPKMEELKTKKEKVEVV